MENSFKFAKMFFNQMICVNIKLKLVMDERTDGIVIELLRHWKELDWGVGGGEQRVKVSLDKMVNRQSFVFLSPYVWINNKSVYIKVTKKKSMYFSDLIGYTKSYNFTNYLKFLSFFIAPARSSYSIFLTFPHPTRHSLTLT